MGPLCPCPHSKKPTNKVPGAFHGALLTPGPRDTTQTHRIQVSISTHLTRGGLTTHGAPRAIGDYDGALVSLPKLKMPMKKVPGASHGAPY
ncbi:unnamed protein product [Staurois parvus]|uniref:Uncharacterized protein n=1 Tax=Staurois parvus TaxID=386267 RepID=A0ABN9DNN7_9NEOB|nr:unnamed protein product [Staurois parvus]